MASMTTRLLEVLARSFYRGHANRPLTNNMSTSNGPRQGQVQSSSPASKAGRHGVDDPPWSFSAHGHPNIFIAFSKALRPHVRGPCNGLPCGLLGAESPSVQELAAMHIVRPDLPFLCHDHFEPISLFRS